MFIEKNQACGNTESWLLQFLYVIALSCALAREGLMYPDYAVYMSKSLSQPSRQNSNSRNYIISVSYGCNTWSAACHRQLYCFLLDRFLFGCFLFGVVNGSHLIIQKSPVRWWWSYLMGKLGKMHKHVCTHSGLVRSKVHPVIQTRGWRTNHRRENRETENPLT